MNPLLRSTALSVLVSAALLAGCAGGSKGPPPELVRIQTHLEQVQADSRIAPFADKEIREAQVAVDTLERDGRRMDDELFDHNIYLADRLVQIAEAEGLARYAEQRAADLGRERETLLLDSRTREADAARRAAELARDDAMMARTDAERALLALDATRARLAELEARQTERGLVVTLGDVLFEVARAELKPGATARLANLVDVLRENPESTIAIEGHTDSTGDDNYNLGLSQRRADSVKAYLISQGIDPMRITARGLGEGVPVASNNDAAGRQQNRRVEVVIQDRPPR